MSKVIMVQGTTSNAGKSFVTAALCRILRQDGYRVAPFKAQNMALNSYITREGLEMGRAQVMQAEAAGIEPDVRMNPILLKPTNDTGSQVILMGEVVGNMPARTYFRYKKELIPLVQQAFDSLAAEVDVVVIEGAGSPAEINLKENDLVNMGMARMAKAPVLLVADIDRGGVFASLAGTMLLLDEEERAMVKGLIINKFRGDPTILQPGVVAIEEMTQRPVVGVLPYLTVDVDDEDSLSDRLTAKGTTGVADVAVIRLPRISNFTDFNPLESIPGLSLRYVKELGELGRPDLIILPGTKNTMGDLRWLRQSGLEAAIQKFAAQGGPVLGICGGYQMLGQQLEDPHAVEEGGTMRGMGLLPVVTTFEEQKHRTQVQGHFGPLTGAFAPFSQAMFAGYEIHMGRTVPVGEALPSLHITQKLGEPCCLTDGLSTNNVLGCYIHGLFDQEETVTALAQMLYQRKGLVLTDTLPDLAAYKEEQYDKLAAGVRENLDMAAIYRILEEGLA